MTEEGRRKGPAAEDVLSPNNFLSYLGAAVHILRSRGWSAVLPFVLLTTILSLGDLAVRLTIEDEGTRLGARLILLFALPLVGSVLAARTARMLAPALAGQTVSFRQTGEDLSGSRSHLLACGMIATLLTLILAQVNPLLGLIGPHLVLGPPILAQVVGLERRTLVEAWARLRVLAKGQALRIFLYLLCAALALVMFEVIIAGLIFTLVRNSAGADAGAIATIPVEAVLTGLGLSFMAAVSLVAYFDCRTRTEDFELDDLRRRDQPEIEEGAPEQLDEPEVPRSNDT